MLISVAAETSPGLIRRQSSRAGRRPLPPPPRRVGVASEQASAAAVFAAWDGTKLTLLSWASSGSWSPTFRVHKPRPGSLYKTSELAPPAALRIQQA